MSVSTTADLLAHGQRYYLPVYRPREVILERGQGARVWDSEGRECLDLSAGIAVCGLGHNDPDLVAALTEQAGKLWHTSNVFYSEPPLRLAEASAGEPQRPWPGIGTAPGGQGPLGGACAAT